MLSLLMMRNQGKKVGLYLLIILVTAVLVVTSKQFIKPPSSVDKQAEFNLLSRRIFLENPNDVVINFTGLRTQLRNYISKSIGEANASVYFEYLPTGSSFSFGKGNEFVAASLLKVPQVMSLYKADEQGGLKLDDVITLKSEWLDDDFGTLYKKGAGYKLTLREAARLTLVESDNTAVRAVQSVLPKAIAPEDESINFLDIDYDLTNDEKVLIRADTYSSILKCLYFSCYLEPEHSQEILNYLSMSTFTERIAAGVPRDVKVAHKVGTYSQISQSDCGIIYLPQRNFILCIMLNQPGPDGSKRIADISELIYDYVNNIKLDAK